MVSLELESCAVNVCCPITSRAACPVVKSPANRAAAQRKNTGIAFMRNIDGRLTVWILSLNYSKGSAADRFSRVMPARHTLVRKWHASQTKALQPKRHLQPGGT